MSFFIKLFSSLIRIFGEGVGGMDLSPPVPPCTPCMKPWVVYDLFYGPAHDLCIRAQKCFVRSATYLAVM